MKAASLRQEPEAASPPAASGLERVAICVATYRRPLGLRRLLDSLADMGPVPGVEPFLVVVDNDAEESARAVIASARAEDFPYPIHYEVEPVRNIAGARNCGVAAALRMDAAWLAFVDDDELVARGWLRALRATAARYGTDVVSGSIRPECPDGTPRWLVRGKFFGQNEQETGIALALAHTGNVLVSARVLATRPEPFDTRFGLTGGSDSHLFMRLGREGVRIVSAGEAVTYEQIPATRARAGWILRRAFRVGNTAMLCERGMPAGRGQPWRRLAKASARMGLGVVTLPLATLAGRGAALDAAWNVIYGVGALAALFGYRYTEYSRVHGE